MFRQGGGVTFQHEQVDFREGALHPRGIKAVVFGSNYPLRRGRLGVL